MEKAIQDSVSLLLSLFYLWWLLDKLPTIIFNWQPNYITQLSTKDKDITNSNYFSNSRADIVLGTVSIVYNIIIKTSIRVSRSSYRFILVVDLIASF
jgi:hypothetical protein